MSDPNSPAQGAPGYSADPPTDAGGGVVGIGTDLCDVDRMRRSLERTPGLKDRLFTRNEQAYCERHRDPSERYAARFAAKEAVLKALGRGLGACPFTDIEVQRAPSGAPSVVLHAGAAELAAERGVRRWELSLTHTASLAHAMVLALH